MARKKFLVIAIIVGLALAVISFIGGSVGAIITGRGPLSIFNVSAPRVELAAGKPFPGLPITNTMIAAWVTMLVLFGLFFTATRKMKLIPTGLQNVVEFLCETAADFIEDIAGKENGRRFFPVVVTIFLFVAVNAWIGLIPGFESIKVSGMPLLRNANTDINVPLMLASVSVVAVEYWGFKAKGVSYLKSFSGPAGPLEAVSHLVRIISFTFRLFGNMTAGIILTSVMIFIIPLVIPSIFYGLEAFFGFVQALIFGGLTLVFGYAAVMSAER